MTTFNCIYDLTRRLLYVGAVACLIVSGSTSMASAITETTACQFGSLHERTRNNSFSRAAYTALQWVEYTNKSERIAKLVEDITSVPGLSRDQVITLGVQAMSAIDRLSKSHPLHKCFDEAFTSDDVVDAHFSGMVFVKGRLALDAPYAMVIPKSAVDPVVLILPTTMYRYHRATGSLRVFDKLRQEYVEVDPKGRRGIDHLIQTNLAKLQN